MSGRCILKVVKVTREDACEFSCEIPGVEKTTCMVVVEEPEFRFIRRLPPQSETQEYAQLELECEIEDPDAFCEWYFDGKKIEPSDKYEIVEDGTKRKLIIKNINPFKDPGRYECKCGFNVTSTQLFVKEALKFTKELATDIEGVEETDFEFNVALNKDDHRLKWYKSNRQIIPTESKFDRYSIVQNGKEHKLIIKSLDLKDAGEIEANLISSFFFF